jgi:peptidoglycan-associated lipoprotein
MTRTFVALAAIVILVMAVGCGANKSYVDEQVAAAEARTDSKIQGVEQKTDANSASLQQLQDLATQLESKTDMALNEAKGFENYQIIWSGEINFAFDSYVIDDMAGQILNEAGAKMTDNPRALVEIAGHTDQTGSSKYNLFLGEKRASSAKRFLAENFGISLYRMFIISYGKDKPVAMADEQNASSRNRRVKLTVWGTL